MRRKWTRRTFLGTSVAGPLVFGGAQAAKQVARLAALEGRPSALAAQEVLRRAMDEIIPAADGMPAASEVGGEEYLTHFASTNADVRDELQKSVDQLQRLSQARFGKDFVRLLRAQRVAILKEFERQVPQLFAALRDDIYEAYYTQPRVWKQIGYKFYPTNAAGPPMKPFDDRALYEVRKKPKRYRGVN